jgi:zinc and cadmium transporter
MFIIEKFLHWHHCHQVSDSHTNIQPYAIMNLIGDGVHNIIDGLIIGASYLVSIPIGIATTIAVVLHEIPQEIGDFGVLIYGGLSRGRALMLNFLTALTAILGAVVSLVAASSIEGATTFLVPLAAGQFIYIAVADLIPEIHKETDWKKSLIQLALFVLGVVVMVALLSLE